MKRLGAVMMLALFLGAVAVGTGGWAQSGIGDHDSRVRVTKSSVRVK